LATALGEALALLHQTDIVRCPFDQRVAGQIEEARGRIAAGNVREDDFDEIRVGRPPADLLEELIALIPDSEDLVFTHGDFCLPNIILQPSLQEGFRIAGFVDCGRAGIADRHQDIALAVRSISRNFGDEWIEPMLKAYGLAQPRPEKLFFYTLLDEFF
jgi:aminoglycoside 3'-phosphotransferase-2